MYVFFVIYSEYICEVVARTMTHCRRDALWQRMILGDMAEEEGRRKRHKTGDVELRDPVSNIVLILFCNILMRSVVT